MTPNFLTILRIVIIPIYLKVYYSTLENRHLIAGFLFIMAGITDILDGYIARKFNMTSDLGALLDPLADKLILFAVLIPFYKQGILPLWILIVLVVKEIMMMFGGGVLYLFKDKLVIPSNIFGKVATFFFYAASLSIIFKLPALLSTILFVITVVLNVVALTNYLIGCFKLKKRYRLCQ